MKRMAKLIERKKSREFDKGNGQRDCRARHRQSTCCTFTGIESDRGKSHNKETRGSVNPIVYTLALEVQMLSKHIHRDVGDTR